MSTIVDIGRLKVKERRGYSHLKEEALDRTVWRAGFGDRSDRKTRKKT